MTHSCITKAEFDTYDNMISEEITLISSSKSVAPEQEKGVERVSLPPVIIEDFVTMENRNLPLQKHKDENISLPPVIIDGFVTIDKHNLPLQEKKEENNSLPPVVFDDSVTIDNPKLDKQGSEISDEEMDVRLINLLDSFKNYENFSNVTAEDRQNITTILQQSAKLPDRKKRSERIKLLADNDVVSFCKRFIDEHIDNSLNLAFNNRINICMKSLMVILWNGSDAMSDISAEILNNQLHLTFIRSLKKISLIEEESPSVYRVFLGKAILGIFHNILQTKKEIHARRILKENDAVSSIMKYKDHKNQNIQIKSLICLSYLCDESENHLIYGDDDNFELLKKILETTLQSENYYSKLYGYRSGELVRAITLIAANDSNKEKIINVGMIDPLSVMLRNEFKSKEIQKYALDCIWCLSYSEKSKALLKEYPDLLSDIKSLVLSEDSQVSKMAKSALWILNDMTSSPEKDDKTENTSSRTANQKGHDVMISYQWADQEKVKWLRDQLMNYGFKVWMDIDNMSGSTLTGMARAVQDAKVVLICYSFKYFVSNNCRMEAEYTFQKQKPFIPLKMEYKYTPEDWLGIMIGAKLYFDFAREEKIPISIKTLKKEIDLVINPEEIIQPVYVAPSMTMPRTPEVKEKKESEAENWTPQDVQNWLEISDLNTLKDRLNDFDGSLILELKDMLSMAPEYFYKCAKDELGLSIRDVLKLSKSLKKL